MSFDDLYNGIPLDVASRYFIGLKKFGADANPDMTGALEGQFSVPVEQALAIMGDLVKAEFETHYAYKVYAQTLRDLSRDSIAEHFDEHAGDEMDHADFLLKRMSVLGGPAHVPDIPAPPPSADPCDIVKRMIRMEQEGIANWKKLLAVVGENPMRITVEEYMVKEQEHADDLWQLLPYEARTPILDENKPAGAESAEAAPPKMAAMSADPNELIMPEAGKAMSDAQILESGRRKGLQMLGAQMAKADATSGARHGDVAGRMAGAALGGGAGYGLARAVGGNPLAQLAAMGGGALLGQGLGGRVGKDIGLSSDLAAMKEAEARFKTAADEMSPEDKGVDAYQQVSKQLGMRVDPMALQRVRAGMAAAHPTPELAAQHMRDYKQHFGAMEGETPEVSQYNAAVIGRSPLEAEIPTYDAKALAAYKAHPDLAYALRHLDRSGTYADDFKPSKAYKTASQRFKTAAMKLAVGGEIMSDVPAAATEPQPPSGDLPPAAGGPAQDPELMQYLQQEQAGQQAQEQNMAEFYKQRFDQANQQLQAAQQQSQSTQQQLQDMQGQIDQSMQQSQQAMDQARSTQQLSLQQAAAANTAATQAMQQTMAANSELLNQQQLSNNMRNAYQQLQQQLQQVVSQAPPPATTMEAGMAAPAPPGPQPPPGAPPTEPGAEPQPAEAGSPEAAGAGAPPGGGPPPGEQGPEAGGEGAAPAPPGLEGAAPQGEAGQMEQPKTSQVSDLERYLMKGAGAAAPGPFPSSSSSTRLSSSARPAGR